MTDKRILKTKRNIKRTMIDMLHEMPFEKITVTALCERGCTSRITFYTYYEDKYALLNEMFEDYIDEADQDYHRLQTENNIGNDARSGYHNLLKCILNLFYHNFDFFEMTRAEHNPYLYSAFFNHVYELVSDYMVRHSGFATKYPPQQTSAVICNSMFGVISVSNAMGMTESAVRELAESVYDDLLASNLFHDIQNRRFV